jgi:penicillin-binding protein 1A
MKDALRGQPVLDFIEPAGIDWALINPSTGLLALSKTEGVFLEAFKEGTAPTHFNMCSSDTEKQDLSIEIEGF